MSVGKKKSGFQITSVTSDYEQKEGLPGGDLKGPSARPAVADGASPTGDGGDQANGGVGPKNGPLAPGSPGLAPLFPGSIGGISSSRFRVVKLDQGSGEPYKRGRWTCRDFYDQEIDHHLAGRLADSARHPQSLDSRLEVAGLLAKPSSPFSPPMLRRGPCLQSLLVLPVPGASAHQARSLGGGLPVLRPSRTPPSPASLRSPRVAPERRPPAPEEGTQEPGDPFQPGTAPVVRVEEPLLPKSVTQLIPRETEERQKVSHGGLVMHREWVPGHLVLPSTLPGLKTALGEGRIEGPWLRGCPLGTQVAACNRGFLVLGRKDGCQHLPFLPAACFFTLAGPRETVLPFPSSTGRDGQWGGESL